MGNKFLKWKFNRKKINEDVAENIEEHKKEMHKKLEKKNKFTKPAEKPLRFEDVDLDALDDRLMRCGFGVVFDADDYDEYKQASLFPRSSCRKKYPDVDESDLLCEECGVKR